MSDTRCISRFTKCTCIFSPYHPFHHTCNHRSWDVVSIQGVHKIHLLICQLIPSAASRWRRRLVWENSATDILFCLQRRWDMGMPVTCIGGVRRQHRWDQKSATWGRGWCRLQATNAMMCRNVTHRPIGMKRCGRIKGRHGRSIRHGWLS